MELLLAHTVDGISRCDIPCLTLPLLTVVRSLSFSPEANCAITWLDNAQSVTESRAIDRCLTEMGNAKSVHISIPFRVAPQHATSYRAILFRHNTLYWCTCLISVVRHKSIDDISLAFLNWSTAQCEMRVNGIMNSSPESCRPIRSVSKSVAKNRVNSAYAWQGSTHDWQDARDGADYSLRTCRSRWYWVLLVSMLVPDPVRGTAAMPKLTG